MRWRTRSSASRCSPSARGSPASRARCGSSNREQALAATSTIVSDWDGGTRIGDALQAFLAVPRFAGYARGAVVLILSDGLERGDPAAMREAVTRLSRARLARELAHAARRRSELQAADRGAEGDPAAGRRSRRRLLGRGGLRARARSGRRSAPHDRHRRRASPHLAAGRHAVAVRPDAAAHLRALRADPARLSDRRVSRGPRRHRRDEVGLRAGELAEGQVRGRGRLGERGRGRDAAGRTASSAMPTSPSTTCARSSTG